MFDARKLLDQFLAGQMQGSGASLRQKGEGALKMARNNPWKTGALLSVLLGSKTGRSVATGALKAGGLALIAGLGYSAYRNYKSGKAPEDIPALPELPAVPDSSPFSPAVALGNDFALTLVKAMIAAAKADGHIDDEERVRILEKIHAVDLGDEAEAFLAEELANPTNMDALVAAARSEEQKVELYTASRLTIDPDTRAERGYLDLLAGRLGLPEDLLAHIEATVRQAKSSHLEQSPSSFAGNGS
ncbi:tellurite resistance TerB family protein [Allorhizobium undicola]|uniref:tellurite resistance TerB family protein n=1 Tax=Allorhizobium undicola TaxID=78527 RepID=UPI0004808164|nr:tellurite resistance TerB family protein [Allorhizobium undicola]